MTGSVSLEPNQLLNGYKDFSNRTVIIEDIFCKFSKSSFPKNNCLFDMGFGTLAVLHTHMGAYLFDTKYFFSTTANIHV